MEKNSKLSFVLRSAKRDWFILDLMALFIGVLAGYGAIFFRYLIGFFQHLFLRFELGWSLISPLSGNMEVWSVLIPAFILAIVAVLVNTLAREAKGHGVPEVMEAQISRQGRIRPRVVGVKALASALTIACGGAVGREGPIVQIGAAAASSIGQFFKVRPQMLKILVGCGVAGSIAATFNTPVGGVIFAIELVLLELRTNSFIPLVISSVFATIISRLHLGNKPSFIVQPYSLISPVELIFYLGLGILAGVVGVLLIRAVYWAEDRFDEHRSHYALKAFGGGLCIGVIGLAFPEILGVGYEAVSRVLMGDSTLWLMLSLVFLKIMALSITLAAGGSGGVFAPSLFVGSMLGGSYGVAIHWLAPEITASYGAYALVGMAAVFSASSRATFTSIVILFEMTLDYSIILPLMFACVAADRISSLLSQYSIYSFKLARKGIPFAHDITANIFALTPIKEVMSKNVDAFLDSMTLKQARDVFLDKPHTIFPVVDEACVLMGAVRASNLSKAINEYGEDASIQKIPFEDTAVVHPNDSTEECLNRMRETRDPRILVVDGASGKLVGIVSPRNIINLELSEKL